MKDGDVDGKVDDEEFKVAEETRDCCRDDCGVPLTGYNAGVDFIVVLPTVTVPAAAF